MKTKNTNKRAHLEAKTPQMSLEKMALHLSVERAEQNRHLLEQMLAAIKGLASPSLSAHVVADSHAAAAVLPMYGTDEYPRNGLTLTIRFPSEGRATMEVRHPFRQTPMERYFLTNDGKLVKTLGVWLGQHPAAVAVKGG